MSKTRILGISLIVIASLFLSACDGLLARPTATPTVTQTPQPTETSTPTLTPTSTATPTLAPTPTEEVAQTKFYNVPGGGYSFELPPDDGGGFLLNVSIIGSEATIEDLLGTMFIYIVEGTVDYTVNLEQVINGLAAENVYGENDIDPVPFEVGGFEARRLMMELDYEDVPFLSEVIVVKVSNHRIIMINTMLFNDSLEERWEDEMLPFQEDFLNSFEIYDPVAGAVQTECEVSTDPTYGYSEDNAIRVGGGAFEGPFNERTYLDNLLGPNGEIVTYERMGSIDYGNTILDVYSVTYSGLASPITLYIDEYLLETLYAPVGFTCQGPFTITGP